MQARSWVEGKVVVGVAGRMGRVGHAQRGGGTEVREESDKVQGRERGGGGARRCETMAWKRKGHAQGGGGAEA